MNTQQIIKTFKSAGFITESLSNGRVMVSLNRQIDTIEAQMVIGDRRNKIVRSGNAVIVSPLIAKIK